jgi:DNA-binding transcriptional regulator YiaG
VIEDALLADAVDLVRTGRGRDLRERSGVTLEELAAAVGVPPVELMAWELGEREPRGPAAGDYVRVVRALSRRN